MHAFPQNLQLKDGSQIQIRVAEKSDAAELIDYAKKVGGETDFLTFAPEDFNETVEEEEKFLDDYASKPNQIFLVVEKGGMIVGALDISSHQKPRLKHIGNLGISIFQSEWGKGIGSALMGVALDWAKSVGLRKINLKVDTRNQRAISLYERFGFKKEGTLRRDGFVKGEFTDSYVMGLSVD